MAQQLNSVVKKILLTTAWNDLFINEQENIPCSIAISLTDWEYKMIIQISF